jgi:hypothetical protein
LTYNDKSVGRSDPFLLSERLRADQIHDLGSEGTVERKALPGLG